MTYLYQQSELLWVDGPPEHPGPLYNPRFLMCAGWVPLAGSLLGIARGAMDTFIELATDSASNLSDTILRERSAVQIEVAQSEAIINSARAYLLDAVGTAWKALCDGKPDPSREIAQSRLAITHACHEAVRAVDILFHAAGTNSIYRRQRIEQSFRDVHVGGQHMAAHAYNVEGAGQVLLGLTPTGLGW